MRDKSRVVCGSIRSILQFFGIDDFLEYLTEERKSQQGMLLAALGCSRRDASGLHREGDHGV